MDYRSDREVQASDAKAHLSQLLDDVDRHGVTVIITRHGRRIARIVPEPDHRRNDINHAIDRIERRRTAVPSTSLPDILSARHEGHRI